MEVTNTIDELEGDLPEDWSVNEVYSCLAHQRSRYTLHHLLQAEFMMPQDVLAERVSEQEFGRDSCRITSEEQKRVEISLYHVHLPRLEDAGLIDYDRCSGFAALPPRTEQLLEQLDCITDNTDEPTTPGI